MKMYNLSMKTGLKGVKKGFKGLKFFKGLKGV